MFLMVIPSPLNNYWSADPLPIRTLLIANLVTSISCMEQGWDPDVKKFLLKVLNSISMSLLWLIACATGGIYYELGYSAGKPVIYTILFYAAMLISLLLLIRYLYNTWNKE
jgi:hypothetical protein